VCEEDRDTGLRERLFPVLWRMLWPIRAYLRHSPLERGKGLLRRTVLEPLLPPQPQEFVMTGPLGGRVRLRYREVIGLACLLDGGFEVEEIRWLCRLLRPGSTAFDVGANLGVFTVPLARAVEPSGAVVAFEPHPGNVARLQANVDLNALSNVRIEPRAVGDYDGMLELRLSTDAAFGSTASGAVLQDAGSTVRVEVVRLDRIWASLGEPEIDVLKIDVEGAEIGVLRGAAQLIGNTRPAILLEANTEEQLHRLRRELRSWGYRDSQPPGFMPWNHLFQALTS
jgi:FkbM family methyltransferase